MLPNGLAVECQFAEGSAANTCSVVLCLEGEEVLREEIDSQKTFPELRSGHYTVLVYESSASASGSGEPPQPAVERTVTITGAVATGESGWSPDLLYVVMTPLMSPHETQYSQLTQPHVCHRFSDLSPPLEAASPLPTVEVTEGPGNSLNNAILVFIIGRCCVGHLVLGSAVWVTWCWVVL